MCTSCLCLSKCTYMTCNEYVQCMFMYMYIVMYLRRIQAVHINNINNYNDMFTARHVFRGFGHTSRNRTRRNRNG